MKCSQELERNAIADKLQEVFSWMQEYGEDAEMVELLDKRSALE